MAARRLERRPVERVWGRQRLPDGFADCAGGGAPIGEIWFESDASDALLVKYLFTADRLSIQVHPDDRLARAAGHEHGKDEAWLVLDAEPGAVIGLGLNRPVSKAELRAAALDGSIEALVDWRKVKAGDAFFSLAGTVHAIGGGLTLIEIQQNLDLTYRLYDYGRPRELHLDAAVEAAITEPTPPAGAPAEASPGRRILASGGTFTVERWTLDGRFVVRGGDGLWLVPLGAGGTIDGQDIEVGSAWRVEGEASLDAAAGADLLAAYPGAPAADPFRAAS